MLSKRRCPYTGVVNFYSDADPLLAIGSVSETGEPRHYAWHCYIDQEAGGVSPDMAIAEASLRKAIAMREHTVHAG